jgi:hypothetical protein
MHLLRLQTGSRLLRRRGGWLYVADLDALLLRRQAVPEAGVPQRSNQQANAQR